jgi:hypothetical protein
MMHQRRGFAVKTYDDLDQLVEDLYKCTSWTSCTGFRWNGLLFLNDSFGPDGAQEYGVVRESDMKQIESLTVSWMKPEEFKEFVLKMATVDWSHVYGVVRNKIEPCEGHHCHLCA